MPPKRALIHDHYQEEVELDKDGHSVTHRRCRHCGELYSPSSSNDTLRRHYNLHHKSLPPPRPASCAAESANKRLRMTQSTLDTAVYRINNNDLAPALASLFAHCSWAHRIVELPQLLDVASALRSSTCRLPSRAQLRVAQLKLAESLRTRVVRQLRNFCRSSPLTIAIDGWTNVNTAKVTNVVILCGGEAYYWCSIVNSSHHNTATWLRDPLVKVMNDIRAEGLIFAALVADNERVNFALWEQLLEPFPFLIRSPCVAHLIQLCVLKALQLPGIVETLTQMDELLVKFRPKKFRLQLKEVQIAAKKKPYNLLRPCETRWSSQLYAADRLYQLKSFVDLVIEQPPLFWVNIQQIIEFLKPFQLATDVMQTDCSTLYDTYSQFMALLTHIRGLRSTSLFYTARDDIATIIINMWEKHINLHAIVCCAILSFDSSVDVQFTVMQIHAAEQWFFGFAAKYAQYWTLGSTNDYEALRREVKLEWANFKARAAETNFCSLSSDIHDFRLEHGDDQRGFDPRPVWNMHLNHAPVLAHAAVALLSVAASEAAVERTFSAQGDVHSKRRNRLADKTVEAEMFIKFNEGTVRAVEEWEEERKDKKKARKRRRVKVPELVMEMSEDATEEEISERAVSVKSLFARPERVEADEEEEKEAVVEEAEEEKSEPLAPAVVSAVPPPPAADATEAFIRAFVREHKITVNFGWRAHHEGMLEAAGMEWVPKMRDGPAELKRLVKRWVKDQAEMEEEEEEEQENEDEVMSAVAEE